MTAHVPTRPMDGPAYLSRTPERLVLEGYRGWTWAMARQSRGPWEPVRALYRDHLGDGADDALGALDSFFRTLGTCATCPLLMRGCGAQSICRDEALVLGLIAGLQHKDEPTIGICLSSICIAPLADRVALSAAIYALLLGSQGQRLLPIPAHVIAHVLIRETERRSPTFH